MEEVLELLFGEHGIDDFKDRLFVVFSELLKESFLPLRSGLYCRAVNDPSTRPVQALFRTSLWQSPSLKSCIGRTQWTVKKRNRDKLAKQVQVHGAVIGRYKCDEVKPSIKVPAKIADALGVLLDYLVGKTSVEVDAKTLKRL